MKAWWWSLIGGLVGGLLAVGGMWWLMSPIRPTKELQRTSVWAVNRVRVSDRGLRLNVSPSLIGQGICDFTEAARRALPAVVSITAVIGGSRVSTYTDNWFFKWFEAPFEEYFGPHEGKGSGVIYRSDGYVLTNYHVVEGASEVWVSLYDNRTFEAELVGTYPPSDIAVLKINARDLPTMPLGDSDAAQVGQWVLAVGNPMDLRATVTAGIISAKGRDIDIIRDNLAIESFIQTDAVVNPGNSGGALVDMEGRLLGINTAIATQTGFYQGYSFAIPINLAAKIADDIVAYGSYQRGFLGLEVTELDTELAQQLDLNTSQGVIVTKVIPESPAAIAGIQVHDLILAVDGHPISSAPTLLEYVGRARVGQTLHLTLDRKGKKLQIAVVLKGIK